MLLLPNETKLLGGSPCGVVVVPLSGESGGVATPMCRVELKLFK